MKNIISILLDVFKLFCASINRVNLILLSRLMHPNLMVSSLVTNVISEKSETAAIWVDVFNNCCISFYNKIAVVILHNGQHFSLTDRITDILKRNCWSIHLKLLLKRRFDPMTYGLKCSQFNSTLISEEANTECRQL